MKKLTLFILLLCLGKGQAVDTNLYLGNKAVVTTAHELTNYFLLIIGTGSNAPYRLVNLSNVINLAFTQLNFSNLVQSATNTLKVQVQPSSATLTNVANGIINDTNVHFYSSLVTTVPAIVHAGSTNPVEIYDVNGNLVAYVTTNGYWRGTNDVFATLQTTDNTTNSIYTFTPRNNSVVRVWIQFSAYNSTSSAGYTKVGVFKNVAGTVTQVGSTASIGAAEDDTAFESLIDLSGTTVRVRVAGNTAKTVNWAAYITLYYSE